MEDDDGAGAGTGAGAYRYGIGKDFGFLRFLRHGLDDFRATVNFPFMFGKYW